jgi:hypothetical protein
MSEKLEPLTICSTCNKQVYFEDFAPIKHDYDWCKCYQPDTTEEWMTSEQQRETARLRAALDKIKGEIAQFEKKFPGDYCIDALTYNIKGIIADAEK